jgi:hypothetical protein
MKNKNTVFKTAYIYTFFVYFYIFSYGHVGEIFNDFVHKYKLIMRKQNHLKIERYFKSLSNDHATYGILTCG